MMVSMMIMMMTMMMTMMDKGHEVMNYKLRFRKLSSYRSGVTARNELEMNPPVGFSATRLKI